jgi:two-component sensor histidine kinase
MTDDLKKITVSRDELDNEVAERKLAEERQKLAAEVLELLNTSDKTIDLIRNLLNLIKEYTGFDAVGIRLRKGEDYPYFETIGFPAYFIEAERYLCARDQSGELIRDSNGKVYLECMCGNIISGRTDPSLPFFTEGGSFWTNSTSELLASTSKEDRQTHTRNLCNKEGYESVALIPVRSKNEIVGLIQLNDHRKDMFTYELIRFFEGLGASVGISFERKHSEEELQRRTHDLGERVKELNCLYGITEIVETEGISLEGIIQGIVEIIPPSWQFPEVTCVRTIFEGKTFKTSDFKETVWKQSAELFVLNKRTGVIEVCYLEEKPESDEGPFLKEERALINAIAERLGRIVEHKRAEEGLREYAKTQEVLLKEVNHRVKNNLTAIMGMLNIEEERAEAEGSPILPVLKDLEGRIMGLSTVHSMLSASGWRPLLLSQLCEEVISGAIKGIPLSKIVELNVSPSDVRVTSNQAHHLTLVINELATNSIKHSLKGRDTERIDVGIERKDGDVLLRFRDDGPGYPDEMLRGDFSRTGAGFDLIKGIVDESLRGRLELENENGSVTTIAFSTLKDEA